MLKNDSLGINIQKQKITYVKIRQNRLIEFDDKLVAELEKTFKNDRGKTAVPFHQTFSKTITVNNCLDENDIQILLKNHQKKYFPAIDEPLNFDFKILSTADIPTAKGFSTLLRSSRRMTNEGVSRRNVYEIREDGERRRQQSRKFIREGYKSQTLQVIAAFKSGIQKKLAVLKNICPKIIAVEPDSHAILRVLLYTTTPKFENNETALLIAGGQDIQIIAFSAADILEVKQLVIEKDDLIKTITYLQKQFNCGKVFCMTTPAMQKKTECNLSIPIITVEPFKNFPALDQTVSGQNHLSYLTALGLALKEEEPFNFLPWRQHQKRKQYKTIGLILLAISVINSLLFTPFYAYFSNQLARQKKRNEILKNSLQKLSEKQKPYQNLKNALAVFQTYANQQNNLINKKT